MKSKIIAIKSMHAYCALFNTVIVYLVITENKEIASVKYRVNLQ